MAPKTKTTPDTMQSAVGEAAAITIYERMVSTDYWAFLTALDCWPSILALAEILELRPMKSEAFTLDDLGAFVFIPKQYMTREKLQSILRRHAMHNSDIPLDRDVLVPATNYGQLLARAIYGAFLIGEDAKIKNEQEAKTD